MLFDWNNLPGTGLSSEEYEKALTLDWKPNLRYNWDDGIAISTYLRGLKAGKIVGAYCDECGRIMLPARAFCELCYRATDEWVDVKDTGTVNTFSICRVNWDSSRIPEGEPPHLPAVIEIDGASDEQGIMHMLGDVDPDKIHIGMRVKAVWKSAEEREGAITDILYFKPLDEEE